METHHSFSSSSSCSSSEVAQLATDTEAAAASPQASIAAVQRALSLVASAAADAKLEGAREIRRLTKTSHRCRRLLSDSVAPLAAMLRAAGSPAESHEAALLALLNLAVRDEMNKAKIVEAGALEPIISFLTSHSSDLQEYATVTLLTLSASAANKAVIGAAGAVPPLVEAVRDGTEQTKSDAITTLANLSTIQSNLIAIAETKPVPLIVGQLKSCKKSSKTAEKCCAVIESLSAFEEARSALISEPGGVLAVVEALENGSARSRGHAIGALLAMCQSDRRRYREPILKEGVIPGLLEMTVHGSPEVRAKAKALLRLLRDSPYQRSEFKPDTLENIVCNIISQIDGEDQSGKAKKMLAEMVQVSMEQSLRHLQQRALVGVPNEF